MALAPKKVDEFTNEENPTDGFEFIGWEPEPTVPPEAPAVGGATRNITLAKLKSVTVTKEIVEGVLTGEISSHTHSQTGPQGEPGYTPVKGVDYFDGEQGAPGYTPIKGIDYFDGEQGPPGYTPVKGVDYFDGEQGEPGYTPVKGVDYFDGEQGPPGESGQPFDIYNPIFPIEINRKYLVDTLNATVHVTLPENPSVGDYVSFADANGYFGTNNLIVEPSAGDAILGEMTTLVIDVDNTFITMVYSGATRGWLLEVADKITLPQIRVYYMIDNYGYRLIDSSGNYLTMRL